ncbi:TIGR00282 family metallophosphoesterase [Ruminococcus sp.]|uniref:TIGR00282 family metallophosphoesterase n=1 Tax=Ruminococcus sp. TaxID=41978 RepID=UPI00388D50C0
MRIMCIGDVVGSVGCSFLRQHLSSFKRQQQIDFVICNGENSADGNGITPRSAEHLFTSGVDFITLGNHSFRRREVYPVLDENPCIIRPANFPSASTPGRGWATVDMGFTTLGIVNLMGQQCMDAHTENPFLTADKILREIDAKIILVDFHAEATSEKRAMGFYLDGRVSAVFGTHTHVLTADAEVLPNGTGYITDIGMTGVIDSCLGVKKEIILRRFTTQLPERFELASGDCKLNCAVFDIDRSTGKCTAAQSFELR